MLTSMIPAPTLDVFAHDIYATAQVLTGKVSRFPVNASIESLGRVGGDELRYRFLATFMQRYADASCRQRTFSSVNLVDVKEYNPDVLLTNHLTQLSTALTQRPDASSAPLEFTLGARGLFISVPESRSMDPALAKQLFADMRAAIQ